MENSEGCLPMSFLWLMHTLADQSTVEHGSGLVDLREKFHLTESNRIEENSICYRSFIMYKSFETKVNGL